MAKKKQNASKNNEASKNNVTNAKQINVNEDNSINWMWHAKVLISIIVVILILFFSIKSIISNLALNEVKKAKLFYENALKLKDTSPVLLDSLPEDYNYIITAQNVITKSMDLINEHSPKKNLKTNDFDYFENALLPELKTFRNKLQKDKAKNITFAIIYNETEKLTNKLIEDFTGLVAPKKPSANALVKIAIKNFKVFNSLFEHCQYLTGIISYPLSIEAAIDLFNKGLNIDNRCVEAYYYIGKTYQLTDWSDLAGRYLVRAYYYGKNTKLGKDVLNIFKNDLTKYKNEYTAISTKANATTDAKAKAKLVQEKEKIKNMLMQAYYNLGMINYFDKNNKKAKDLFDNVVKLDMELKSFTAFMAEKRINSLGKKFLEIEYDPRL